MTDPPRIHHVGEPRCDLNSAVEEPAHSTAADFTDLTSPTILAHRDEAAAQARYPLFALSG
jgi:hypothetical protein